jgi:Aromatic-ring-opening dioxygenase LigAB, LigA subunit
MSVHAAEKVLWMLGNQPSEAEKFKQDRRAYLNNFALEADERGWLETLDVKRLADRGVNPLLLLGVYRAIQGGDSIPEYMQRMNTP